MAKTLKAILSKSQWTGKEIGLAILYRQALGLNGKPQQVSQELINERAQHMANDQERIIGSAYISLNNLLNSPGKLYNKTNNGKIRAAFDSLIECLNDLYSENTTVVKECSRPLTLTEHAYQELINEQQASIFNSLYSYFDILSYTLLYCVGKCSLGESDDIPAYITDALLEDGKDPIKNPRAIKAYLKSINALPENYKPVDLPLRDKQLYVLKLTGVKPAAMRAIVDQRVSEYIKGDSSALIDFLEDVPDLSIFYNLDSEELAGELTEEIYKIYLDQTYTELRTFRGLLELPKKLYSLYENLDLYTIMCADGTPERQRLKELQADFPRLYQAIDKYMQRKISKFATLAPNQRHKGIIGFDELKDYPPKRLMKGKKSLADLFKPSTLNEYILQQQASTGTAIITNGDYSSGLNETSGGILQPDLSPRAYHYITFKELKRANGAAGQHLAKCRQHLIDALASQYAYAAYLKITFEVMDVSFFDIAYPDFKPYEQLADSYNKILYNLYCNIRGTKAETLKRRKAIKSLLQPIDISLYRPLPEKVAAEKAVLKEMYGTEELIEYLNDALVNCLELKNREGAST